MRAGTLLAVTLALMTTGCLGIFVEDDLERLERRAADVSAFAELRLLQDHEHLVHEDHAGTIGFDTAVFTPAGEGAYPDGETYFEMAVKGGFAYVTFGPRAGFVNPNDEAGVLIYDVADPLTPVEVGRWLGQPPSDVEVSDDGELMFVSTQRNGYPYPLTINADAGLTGHLPRGTFIVDVSDKTSPETVGFAPLPTNGPHTITYFRMPDGRELVFHATYDIVFTNYPENVGQNSASQKIVIMELERGGPTPSLVPLSTYQILEPEVGTSQLIPHDATAHVDPATGAVIMSVAYWDHGLVLLDISDPSEPNELARFADTSPSAYVQTHLARVFPGTIDGRVIAVMEPEIPSGSDAGQYTFVDVTEPTAPVRLGYWAIPGELVIDLPFIFSPHNFDLVCGGTGQAQSGPERYAEPCDEPRVVLSHFHGGLWVLDASDPMAPQAIAFHFPLVERDNIDSTFPPTGFATAFMVDDVVYAPETWTGLYTLSVAERID